MADRTSMEKGNALEDAVRQIESAILNVAPGFSKGTFQIQGKRIFISGGVKHEIDIYVTASLAVGYEAVFIFECKNWKSKVSKNELIVFSEKIAAAGAQRGFFVAPSFTKDAVAQAKKDARIVLLTSSYFEPAARLLFPQFHVLNTESTNAEVEIFGFGSSARAPLEFEGKFFTISGEKHSASEYLNQQIVHIRDKRINELSTSMQEGEQVVPFEVQLDFPVGQAYFEDKPIRLIRISGMTRTSLVTGSISSIYEVETRGRLLVVGAKSGGIEYKLHLVELAGG